MSCLRSTYELEAALEDLYRVFQAYPLGHSTNPCLHCHSPEDEKPLYSKPLRRLTEKDLFLYSMDAVLTWGNADNFRHFLPRIFELTISSGKYSFADREIVLSKLCHAEWRSWPESEQKAVEQVLNAVWQAVLLTPPEDEVYCADALESWLCAIAQAEDDLTPYLQAWLESSANSDMESGPADHSHWAGPSRPSRTQRIRATPRFAASTGSRLASQRCG